ncbi:MAG: DUF742 domain-containing protein [Pseudonocardiaceae bacterium]
MFVSFGSSGTGKLTVETALDPGPDGYRARHAQPEEYLVDEPHDELAAESVDELPDAAAEVVEPDVGTPVLEVPDEWAIDECAGSEDFRFTVRPYTWTRGRTRPLQDLAVETLVFTTDEGRDVTALCSAEHAPIVELCADVRSVAEVAALLRLPLGVARVLLADMIDTGLIQVHRNPMGLGSAPDVSLLERVLAGLHRL